MMKNELHSIQKNNRMKCKNIHRKLIFYFEGTLPANEKMEIDAHLSECNSCRRVAGEMGKILEIISLEKSPEVSPFFYTRVKARLESALESEKQTVGFPVWERVLQPALFSVLLIAGIFAGIVIGHQANFATADSMISETEQISFLNEMISEPIETFFME